MHTANRYLFLLTTFSFLLIACASDDDDTVEGTQNEIVPSNLIIDINIAGQGVLYPNGDGSGNVNITASATNASSYIFEFDENVSIENTTGIASYQYTAIGKNSYTVTVTALSETGNSVSHFRQITVYKGDSNEAGPGTQLIWSDEFDSPGAPDTSKWTYDLGDGCPNVCNWGNGEAQYYTDRTENVEVKDGILRITAKRENYQGYDFTSTRLKTQGKFSFTYGRIEVRAKLPSGIGTWPAIWMLGDNITTVGWPACGEIDIMEHVGKNLGSVQSAMHTPSSHGATVNHGSTFISDTTTAFHVYTMEWSPEKIEFFVDDHSFYTYNPNVKTTSTWPYTGNQFIILNIAMGGVLGGPIENSFQESSMEVDYVRVYQ